jgi:GxxExxY protein
MTPMAEMEFDGQTYAIIGAAQRVHRVLGCGFLERVYQTALAREFRKRGIPFEREVEIPVVYDGEPLDCLYRCDFICYGRVLVETKAQDGLTRVDEAQVINYLRAGPLDIGLLMNFGGYRLQTRRFASPALLNRPSASSVISVVPSAAPGPVQETQPGNAKETNPSMPA